MAALGIVSYRSIHRFTTKARQDDHSRQILTRLAELSNSISASEAAAHAYLLTGEAKQAETWRQAAGRIDPQMQALRQALSDYPNQQQDLNELQRLIQGKSAAIGQLVALRRDEGVGAVRQQMRAGGTKAVTQKIDATLAQIGNAQKRALHERFVAEQANGRRAILIIVIGSLLALAMVALAGWMFRHDILARGGTERELRDIEERFRIMIDAVQDYAIYTLDTEGRIISWNRGAQRIKGYQAQEILGRNFSLFHTPEDQARGMPAIALKTAAEEGRFEEEAWRIRKDGSRFWANVVVAAVWDENGNLRGFTKVTRDVTERMHAEKAIRDLNKSLELHAAQLEAANKELEAFSYSVSHDLRAPLRSIDGFSQALMEDYADKLDEDGKDSLRRVRGATQRMGQLIDDLLNLSRVTRSEMRHETVDLSEMARSVAAELQKSQPERTVSFMVEDDLTVQGDSHLLRVVLDNLIGNAWKFTSKKSDATIEFGATEEGAFFVRDNGVGFDMKYAEKLFGTFQRLHGIKEFTGTGIGLATVQRIIHRHGGQVWAEGEVDRGATFYFKIAADTVALHQAA